MAGWLVGTYGAVLLARWHQRRLPDDLDVLRAANRSNLPR